MTVRFGSSRIDAAALVAILAHAAVIPMAILGLV